MSRILQVTLVALTAALIAPLDALAADASAKDVTFAKDIAPLFQKKCQFCHHEGTAAQMSLFVFVLATVGSFVG